MTFLHFAATRRQRPRRLLLFVPKKLEQFTFGVSQVESVGTLCSLFSEKVTTLFWHIVSAFLSLPFRTFWEQSCSWHLAAGCPSVSGPETFKFTSKGALQQHLYQTCVAEKMQDEQHQLFSPEWPSPARLVPSFKRGTKWFSSLTARRPKVELPCAISSKR